MNWESLPLLQLTMDDIDDSVINFFKEKAAEKGRLEKEILNETKEQLIKRLYLKNGEHLTQAAALLFTSNPEKWFLGAYVKIGYFENDADLIYQDEVHGSLLQQVDKALDLIYFKYLRAKISYNGIQRIERYPFPHAAIREALLNSVAHKMYSSGIPIQVSIYDDKMYIANIGKLPETWTVENLLNKHVSKPYNPDIAHVFYLAGFIESWGRGIEKIYDACRKDGIPDPEYTIHPEDIMIKFTAPEERVVRIAQQKLQNRVTDRVTDKVTDKVTDRVTDLEMAILTLLLEDPAYSYTQLAKKASVSRKTIALKMKKLQDRGIITRIGSSKKGYWKINEN